MFRFFKTRKNKDDKAETENRVSHDHLEQKQPELYPSRSEYEERQVRLAQLREEYRGYYRLLESCLKDRGITLAPVYITDLADTQPLRNDEYAVYLFDVGERVFALPSSGSGLQNIDADQTFCHLKAAGIDLLAAGTDGETIYALTGKGKLIVIDPADSDDDEDEEEDPAEGVQIIDSISYCLKAAEKAFSEKQTADAVTAFCSRGIVEVDDRVFYDPEAQSFFRIVVDGNYYHGYDVDYDQMSKEEVIAQCIENDDFSIKKFVDDCRAGKVPVLAILLRLPFTEGPYNPPTDFGYGVYFV